MNFSCSIAESEIVWEEHASAQLDKIPSAAGDPELCSCTKSRTKPRTVVRTSFRVREEDDGVGEENLNQLFLPLRLVTDEELRDLECDLGVTLGGRKSGGELGR